MPPLCCLLLALALGADVSPARTVDVVSPEQARDDVILASRVAEAALPDLYWHQSPRQWNAAKRRALADAAKANDAMDVYVAVVRLMAHVGEGHLNVVPSEAARARQHATAMLLPLDLHWSSEGIFVSAVHGRVGDVPVGSRLLSVNGEDAEALLSELLAHSTRDGRIRAGAMRECAGSCYAVMRQRIRGNERTFDVEIETPGADSRTVRLQAHPMRERPARPARQRRVATLTWLDDGTAILEVSTFSNRVYREAGTTFVVAIQRIFEELEERGADRLILDLRENGGGSEPNEAILFSHLVREPLKRYRSVEARGRYLTVQAPAGKVFEHEVFDADEMRLQSLRPDGRLVRLNKPPEGLMSHWTPATPVFDGTLVVLIGGRTFSGGAELASMLHHVRRARFVGEETGGTYEGNTSGYSWDLVLPHSGVELGIPLLRFRFDWDASAPGRGVIPDCEIAPRVEELGNPRDRTWRVAHTLVQLAPAQALACPD